VKKLIECGEFGNGFVVHSCLHCGTKLVIPFTCKSRLCISCLRKSLFGWSMQLSELMYTSFHHVHVTFTIPIYAGLISHCRRVARNLRDFADLSQLLFHEFASD
jgi:hypothetical protein